jgi:hypothetical protein
LRLSSGKEGKLTGDRQREKGELTGDREREYLSGLGIWGMLVKCSTKNGCCKNIGQSAA